MITLTPITDPVKLDEYYRFRYRIYTESRLKGFVADAEGIDKDAYDDRAHHFGWYVDGKLAGCIRFIETAAVAGRPDASDAPIPMFSYMTDPDATSALHAYLAERHANGERVIEASRFCLAPEHRGLRTAREFVLAMVTTMQPLGFEHGLFDCHESQSAFYRSVGFETVGPHPSYVLPLFQQRTTIFQYCFHRLIARNHELLERMGFTQGRGVRKAA